jgi:hypothetical protein
MLVRNNVVLILRIDRLVLRRDVDLVIWETVTAEVLEEICIASAVHVHLGEG